VKVGVLCEESGVVRDEFARLGHDAWSCDILPRGGKHIRGDCLAQDWSGFGLLICFPPCTYLCRSGQRWLTLPNGETNKRRWRQMQDALGFFMACLDLGSKYRCRVGAENPRMHCHAAVRIGPSTQKIQPWQFGHGEVKETHLWLRGLPPLVPTNIVEGREARVHLESPGPLRARRRSRTYIGIAKAMAEQWGALAKEAA
jgi:hypothetical protein